MIMIKYSISVRHGHATLFEVFAQQDICCNGVKDNKNYNII